MLLTPDSPRAPQPPGAALPLKAHQLALLRRARELEADPTVPVAVMGEAAGGGKTFVLLSLVLGESAGCTVVVVPHNIYGQWRDAVARFAPGLSCRLFADYASISDLYFETGAMMAHRVLIVTSLFYPTLAGNLKASGERVRRVVFDEVDSIRGMMGIPLPAERVWLVSASVGNLPQDGGVVRAGGYEVPADVLGNCVCEPAFVKEAFGLVDPERRAVASRDHFLDAVLARGVVPPAGMVALNVHDYRCVVSPYQSRVVYGSREAVDAVDAGYAERVREATARVAEARKDMETATGSAVDRLRKAEREWCARLEAALADAAALGALMTDALLRERDPVVVESYAYGARSDRGKVENAAGIVAGRLAEDPGAKFLVLSDNTAIFGPLCDALAALDVAHDWMDAGTAGEIDAAVVRYKTGATSALLMDSSLVICGMDLENTTDLVFMHACRGDMAEQLEGRAQRPGRPGRLRIWSMLHANEVRT